MKLLTDGGQYEVGVDVGVGKDVSVIERWYEDGSYTVEIDGVVSERRPSPYFHGGPPFFELVLDPIVPKQENGPESEALSR